MMIACRICDHAEIAGSWPQELLNQGGTHCGWAGGCHRSWTSKVEAHCARCHQHFSADSVADLHEPYCVPDPTEAYERVRAGRRKDGSPVLATRVRKDGLVWITGHAPGAEPPQWSVKEARP